MFYSAVVDKTKSFIQTGTCLAQMDHKEGGGLKLDSEGWNVRSTLFVGGLGIAAVMFYATDSLEHMVTTTLLVTRMQVM